MNQEPFDSSKGTLLHIQRVNALLVDIAKRLMDRAVCHDTSKLKEPEKSAFDLLTPEFRKLEYGSKEYYEFVNRPEVLVGTEHHHANNTHHPQYYPNGVNGMSLLDVMEMLVDWKAATERNPDASFLANCKHNFEKFDFSPQLQSIFLNTAKELGFLS